MIVLGRDSDFFVVSFVVSDVMALGSGGFFECMCVAVKLEKKKLC